MKPVRVLDAGHVLTVCTHAAREAGESRLPKIALTSTGEAVTIRIAADAARIAAILGALYRAGYDAAADGDTITVRGWSPVHLHRRIARLDAAVQWLTEQLTFTPRTAVAAYQAGIDDHALTARAARDTARHEVVHNLRGLVEHQVGPFTSHDQPGRAGDPRIGMLLRQCRWLEDDVAQLLDRHRAIATEAVAEHRLTTATARHTARYGEARSAGQPAAVAAHDAPAEVGAQSGPDTGSTPSVRDGRPAAPTRRGA